MKTKYLVGNNKRIWNRQYKICRFKVIYRRGGKTMTDYETAKSEAIKEFAERLKRYSFVYNLSLDGKKTVYVDDIDNLVKEMTEVNEDE